MEVQRLFPALLTNWSMIMGGSSSGLRITESPFFILNVSPAMPISKGRLTSHYSPEKSPMQAVTRRRLMRLILSVPKGIPQFSNNIVQSSFRPASTLGRDGGPDH